MPLVFPFSKVEHFEFQRRYHASLPQKVKDVFILLIRQTDLVVRLQMFKFLFERFSCVHRISLDVNLYCTE